MRISIIVSESSSGLSNCVLKFWNIFDTRISINREQRLSTLCHCLCSVCDKLSVTVAYIFAHTGSLLHVTINVL